MLVAVAALGQREATLLAPLVVLVAQVQQRSLAGHPRHTLVAAVVAAIAVALAAAAVEGLALIQEVTVRLILVAAVEDVTPLPLVPVVPASSSSGTRREMISS